MAGISSKPAGKTENKKKYNGYELNSDFDINLYESFYRTHDPQIGRFWQIDPKPNELESVYTSMDNNPISNNDPFGDITHFFSSTGQLIESRDDGNDYATITVITEKNMKIYQQAAELFGNIQKILAGTEFAISDQTITKFLQATGVSYDSKEYFDYHDKHSKDYYKGKGKSFQPIDGKGPLKNEHAATTNFKNGYMRIDEQSDEEGDPGNSIPKYGVTGVHCHYNDGRKYKITAKDGWTRDAHNAPGKFSLDNDIQGYGEFVNSDPSRGLFRVVVTDTHIYLYHNGQVTIAVDRKQVPSKTPSDIQ